jgi:drug/metabolite transporter (DMT)-like permease
MVHTGLEKPPRIKILLAFAAVYIIWGSTYLAIRYAVETLPPLLFAGTRFLTAGAVLYGFARWRGAASPAPGSWPRTLIIGGLLLLGGNGAVVLAERSVPSGLTALLIATEPLMVVLLDWARPGGKRPAGRVALGLALGLVGMLVLVGPGNLAGSSEVNLAGAGLLVLATISWAAGSLYAAQSRQVNSPILFAGMQMLMGGMLLFITGVARGELGSLALASVSAKSALSLVYLIIFGSLIAFTSYSWLLRVTSPSMASTYAYVNPVVAVLLGWAVAGENLSPRTLLAAAVIIGAVVLITSHRPHERREPEKSNKVRPAVFGDRECIEAADYS